ncbi:MAG: hypothetical protein V7K27_31215 [Nostoc sp.]|uniref:hypothetical protein n=1 Tax=Nostoc sp. TaxID=1180 RepID=UPI002FF9DAA5
MLNRLINQLLVAVSDRIYSFRQLYTKTIQSKTNDPNIQKLNQLVVDPELKDYIRIQNSGVRIQK